MKTVQELLLDLPLYQKVSFSIDEYEMLYDLKFFQGTIDFYNADSGMNSTFKGTNAAKATKKTLKKNYDAENFKNINNLFLNQYYHVKMVCTRDEVHEALFIYKVTENTIEKIGQYPSLDSVAPSSIEKYRPVLSEGRYSEFNQAISLIMQNVGVGSFVYLHRIFDGLLEEAAQNAAQEESWNAEAYAAASREDQLDLLKDQLPEFLSEQKTIFATLSRGVADLTEQECLSYFSLMKVGIEFILDEKLAELRKQEKLTKINPALMKMHNQLKGEVEVEEPVVQEEEPSNTTETEAVETTSEEA